VSMNCNAYIIIQFLINNIYVLRRSLATVIKTVSKVDVVNERNFITSEVQQVSGIAGGCKTCKPPLYSAPSTVF
jgi:hypothetical protein